MEKGKNVCVGDLEQSFRSREHAVQFREPKVAGGVTRVCTCLGSGVYARGNTCEEDVEIGDTGTGVGLVE